MPLAEGAILITIIKIPHVTLMLSMKTVKKNTQKQYKHLGTDRK